MSYDLYLYAKDNAPSEEDFLEYFKDKEYYQVNGNAVAYENTDTHVHFHLEYGRDTVELEDGKEITYVVTVYLNYIRQNYFILEIMPQIVAMTSHFRLAIHDIQNDSSTGNATPDQVSQSWLASNRMWFNSVMNNEELRPEAHFMPAQTLHDIWQWNFARKELQASMSQDIYVPRIMFMEIHGKAATVVVWLDGMPILTPKADYLLVPREILAPRKYFLFKKPDFTIIPWNEAQAILSRHNVSDEPDVIKLNYATPPADVVAFIKSRPASPGKIEGMAIDHVYDLENIQASGQEKRIVHRLGPSGDLIPLG